MAVVSLLAVSVVSCEKQDVGDDTDRGGEQNFDAESFSDTSGTESMGAESLSGAGNLPDTGEEAGKVDEVPDEVERNLICLRDGDTESLIGISFGEEFDYDKYIIRGSTDTGWAYALKDSGYDSMYYLFDGKGNGFSGLIQYGSYFQENSDFFGISVGEDRVERLSDVLGAYTVENKRSPSGIYTQAS